MPFISTEAQNTNSRSEEYISDDRYVRKSESLIIEALKRGMCIMQTESGDIFVTQTRVHTHRYTWDKKRGRFSRSKSGINIEKERCDLPKRYSSLKDEVSLVS